MNNENISVLPTTKEFDDWINYRNDEYGFEIELPRYLEEYKVHTVVSSDGTIFIGFDFPYTTNIGEKKMYGNALVIDLYKLEDWQNHVYSDESRPVKLSESSTYVYAYEKAEDLGNTIELEFINKDFSKILSTFKLM